jgi:hypothetical protein
VNVKLAAPPDFIPELPGWRKRSPLIRREGRLDVHHFDPYSQALSKLERAFDQDVEDIQAMLDRGLIEPSTALDLFKRIEPELYRYPAIDPTSFHERVERALSSHPEGRGFESPSSISRTRAVEPNVTPGAGAALPLILRASL